MFYSRQGEEKLALDMLKSVGKAHRIDFKKMMKLMRQCHELDVDVKDLIKPSNKAPRVSDTRTTVSSRAHSNERTSTLFSGIIPGDVVPKYAPKPYQLN